MSWVHERITRQETKVIRRILGRRIVLFVPEENGRRALASDVLVVTGRVELNWHLARWHEREALPGRGDTGSDVVIILNRIDSRLIHGQVIEVWLPHLEVRRVVVADDEAASDSLAKAASGLVIPPKVEIRTSPVSQTDYAALGADSVRTFILFRNVKNAVRARQLGLPDGTLNVGNVHAGPGKTALNRSVFLDSEEVKALAQLHDGGMKVIIQAVPADTPTALAGVTNGA